jgi:N-acetylneuraminic acid mutarotase
MTRVNIDRSGAIRKLVLAGLFAIGLIASTAVPALGSSNTWTPAGSMTTARAGHTATLLANGEMLVAGGGNATGSLTSAELYSPATGKWAVSGSMTTARGSHTATLLPNGEVLAAGGVGNGSSPFAPSCIATAELYNPSTGQWTATGSMSKPRGNHTATLLNDGSVLIAGGFCNGGFTYPDNSAELYNPTTGTWKATGNMNVARVGTAATLLPNGHVLISGGNSTSAGAVSAELYDPSTGNWTLTGSMNVYRPNLTATLLPNGDVLVFGGIQLASSASEFYNPATGTWTRTGQFLVAPSRIGHTLTLLGTGKALVAGGRDKYSFTSYSRLYDPATNSWPSTGAGHMNEVRSGHTATLLPNGKVLVAGGFDISSVTVTYLASAELYTP